MIELIHNMHLLSWLMLFVFFACSTFFGAMLIKFYMQRTLKSVFSIELEGYESLSKSLILHHESDLIKVESKIEKVHATTIVNLEILNRNLQHISLNLKSIKNDILSIETLENEIIKYKKIIKRMEKKI